MITAADDFQTLPYRRNSKRAPEDTILRFFFVVLVPFACYTPSCEGDPVANGLLPINWSQRDESESEE